MPGKPGDQATTSMESFDGEGVASAGTQIPRSKERGILSWAYLDLNQGPLPYQGSALTKLSYRPEGSGIVSARLVVVATGPDPDFELSTVTVGIDRFGCGAEGI